MSNRTPIARIDRDAGGPRGPAAPRRPARRRWLGAALAAALLVGVAGTWTFRSAPRDEAPPAPPTRVAEPAPVAIEPPPAPPAAPPVPEERIARPGKAAREKGPPPRIQRPVHRVARGTPAPVELFRGLREIGPDVSARCADQRSGPVRPASASRKAPAAFLVDFETGDGNVQIVEAELYRRGSASDGFIACARAALVGNQIRVAMARSGTRFQLPVELFP